MEQALVERMSKAIKKIGGHLAVLNLPEGVLDALKNCDDYESRVKMMELIAETRCKKL